MKSKNRFIKTIIILTLLFLIIFNTSISSFGQELTGEEIISKVNKLMNQDTVQAKVKMTITTTSDQKRIFIYDSYSKNKGVKKSIALYRAQTSKGASYRGEKGDGSIFNCFFILLEKEQRTVVNAQ